MRSKCYLNYKFVQNPQVYDEVTYYCGDLVQNVDIKGFERAIMLLSYVSKAKCKQDAKLLALSTSIID